MIQEVISGKLMRFAIFGNEYQAKKSVSIQKILSVLSEHKAVVYIEATFFDFLGKEHIDTAKAERVEEFKGHDLDFVISMGGDGTFLKAAACIGSAGIPIIGINMGRLGFLSDTMASEIEQAVEDIYAGNYSLQKHSVIKVEAEGYDFGGQPYALNDIAILKRDSASMISIRTYIDDDYLVTYQADGLVVSTPTGSTAYNLSNGGPILVPDTDTVCLTPVAPHSLNIRPVVVNGSSNIELSVESRSHNILVAVDGKSHTLKEGTKIIISKADYCVSVVKRKGKSYYSTLRDKMMWGADGRI